MYGPTERRDFSHIGGYDDHAAGLLFTWDPDKTPTGIVINVARPSQCSESLCQISANFWHHTREEPRRRLGTYSDSRLKVINDFTWDFGLTLKRAGIKQGEFHDLWRTAICNWFAEGLSELEVMRLARHADFQTTHKYYLKVRDDLVDRGRQASARIQSRNLARAWHSPLSA